MAVGIDGNGTITGLSVGGLPDATIVDADIATLSSSKLTGALPAVDGSALTGVAPTKATIDALGIAASSITGALPAIDGSSLTNMAAGGKVLQVVGLNNTTQSSTTSSSYVTIASLAITTSASTSKVLIHAEATGLQEDSNNYANIRITRGGTTLVMWDNYVGLGVSSGTLDRGWATSYTWLDSPSTAGSITYNIQIAKVAGSSNVWYVPNLTLTEIGA